MRQTEEALIQVRDLRKYFPIRKGILGRVAGHVKAVDDISFDIFPHETLGMVGESGCGKTTAGRSLLRLIEPTQGSAMYKGVDIFKLKPAQLREYRRNLQIIFQDPFSSLNPRMTVENLIGEAMVVHGIATQNDVRDRVCELLERVGLQASYVSRYPHEFSGGQRQRIGIARALALRPEFIVCDEAVSALDVSVQAQVINLLLDLKDEFNLSYLFIAHDLSVVRHISDRIAVKYLGNIVEMSECDELFKYPAHPYTQALLSAIPEANPQRIKERIILGGDVPTPINPPSGCRFHTRCPVAMPRCRSERPELTDVGAGHFVACHLYTEPSRSGMVLSQSQAEVSGLVGATATTVLTNARRYGLDPATKLNDVPVDIIEMAEAAARKQVDNAARIQQFEQAAAAASESEEAEPTALPTDQVQPSEPETESPDTRTTEDE